MLGMNNKISVRGEGLPTVSVAWEGNNTPGGKGLKSPKQGQERIGQSVIQEWSETKCVIQELTFNN